LYFAATLNTTHPYSSNFEGYLVADPTLRQYKVVNDFLVRPLFLIGLVLRVLALLGLYVFDRQKQNKLTICKLVYNCLCCKDQNKMIEQGEEQKPKKKTKDFNFEENEDDVDWEERISSHGPSARRRKAKSIRRMNMLFDLWDYDGSGIIEKDEMKSLVAGYQTQFQVIFGDEQGWKRVDNLGYVTRENFSQFFQWFVMGPTFDALVHSVEHGVGDPISTDKQPQQHQRHEVEHHKKATGQRPALRQSRKKGAVRPRKSNIYAFHKNLKQARRRRKRESVLRRAR
jgi:hypothetical protein|tara:strand:+ start:172 stop:1026 length:855 start_codon:yes stop_codon:yes gene_type:complete